tara:strand:+ start:3712 stop:4242 length:531 start_codon:yes stop_codon:yes gene_type:complete
VNNKKIEWTGSNQIEMSEFIGHEGFWHNARGELLIMQEGENIVLPKGGILVKHNSGKVYLPLSKTKYDNEYYSNESELSNALVLIEERINQRLNIPSGDRTAALQAICLLKFWTMPLQNSAESLGFSDYLGGFIRKEFDTDECESSWKIGFLKAHEVDDNKCPESAEYADKLLTSI